MFRVSKHRNSELVVEKFGDKVGGGGLSDVGRLVGNKRRLSVVSGGLRRWWWWWYKTVATNMDINSIETSESVKDVNISFLDTCVFEDGGGGDGWFMKEEMLAGKVGKVVVVVVVCGGGGGGPVIGKNGWWEVVWEVNSSRNNKRIKWEMN
uniref:Uncharacterized protein n=1 Tax=Tanacetum cinerariifolium TaxID=118510 RepID=A0A699INT8_TANCI|nr:hypothetical protein [Tanacetum cinerariifolium]